MTTNLSGSLSEFSLAEVLSLLGMGGRTARMQVTSPGAVGTVHLIDGRVSSASSDSARAGLLRGIVAALPVPADDLAHALQAEDPVRSLVESGVVDRDAAHRVAGELCTEAIGEMLGWNAGEFAVWVGAQDPSDIGVRLEVEDLVGAARERASDWADLRAALPEPGTVLALVPDVAQPPVVDLDDWAVLARVDGRRTLAEVLAAMGVAPLAAGNRLVQLMGRGLVAVRVDGVDAEQEHTTKLLDAFEVGDQVGLVPGGPVDEVVEVVGVSFPEAVPEVHDLFVTEPEAVEEWQDAATESELYVDDSFPAEVEPRTYELEPVGFAGAADAFDVASEPVEQEAVGFDAEPLTYVIESAGFEAVPGPVEVQAAEFAVIPEGLDVAPVVFEVEPVGDPVAESFAWSPWAQEMGLGEAPAAAMTEPGRFGFEGMVEDSVGHGHTESLPTPQAPISEFALVGEVAPVFAPVGEVAPEFVPVAAPVGEELAQFVPQPRDPADGLVDPMIHAQATGAHAALMERAEVTAAVEAVSAIEEPQGEVPDPLAGGLLAHLMSSVRGL